MTSVDPAFGNGSATQSMSTLRWQGFVSAPSLPPGIGDGPELCSYCEGQAAGTDLDKSQSMRFLVAMLRNDRVSRIALVSAGLGLVSLAIVRRFPAQLP
jgi:hypothetical protein